ncbi:MAG: TolB family protein [Anaerolineae bacterium]
MFKIWIRLFIGVVLGISVNNSLAIDEISSQVGKIAFIGDDYNVYTYTTATNDVLQLTEDASALRHYQWVTWSTDGRLAYFCCEINPANPVVNSEIFVSTDGDRPGTRLYQIANALVIYAYWAPADCGDDCRELAMLIDNASGLSVDILTDSAEPSLSTVGTGGPFYYHWDSTGTQMIFHRSNRDLDIYDRQQDSISNSLSRSSGTFQTPVWSPIDERILVGLQGSERGLTDLAIVDDGQTTILVEDIQGLVSFLWSPNGQYIAYRTLNQFGYSGLTVIDVASGTVISTADTNGVLAFFWSPDSNKIAYITLNSENERPNASLNTLVTQSFVQNEEPTQLLWQVLDIEAGTNLRYSAFIPNYEMLYLLNYFDQFAPSHRLWSPDSRYLVFSGNLTPSERTPQIYMLDTANTNISPVSVANGVFGVWSFE